MFLENIEKSTHYSIPLRDFVIHFIREFLGKLFNMFWSECVFKLLKRLKSLLL